MNETTSPIDPVVSEMFDVAHKAAEAFAKFTKPQIQEIVSQAAKAGEAKAEFYAEWAVRETGYGNVADKHQKNIFNSIGMLESFNIGDYIDPQVDHEKKIVSYPKPAGVVVALVPITNPVTTIFYKAISSLITRNAVILCPHPGAKECCVHAADLLAEAAEKAGAPKGTIQVLREPSIPLVTQLLESDQTGVILATGGPSMVRAAYSSGNPALGVGPGNVACYVDKSADIADAAGKIVISNSFDNSLLCTSESAVVADREISDQLKVALTESGAYFVADDEEQKLRKFIFPEGMANAAAVGKSAEWIADKAGISVPIGTKSLVIEIDDIGHQEPASKEKMFPVLAYFTVDGAEQGIDTAQAMLSLMGKGHSAAIHANDPSVISRYGAALPVCRISVNTISVLGSAGLTTNLASGAVIGTGFFGRSSVDENVGPKQLIQWTRVAYDKDPAIQMGDMDAALTESN